MDDPLTLTQVQQLKVQFTWPLLLRPHVEANFSLPEGYIPLLSLLTT